VLTKRQGITCCFVVLLTCQIGLSQKTPSVEKAGNQCVRESVFHSASLNRDMHYLVLLPCDYPSGARFPVLYLLHGLYGDYKNWDTRTHLESAAAGLPFLIVTPDADDSWTPILPPSPRTGLKITSSKISSLRLTPGSEPFE
jgi:poly(3-hydroxybutyrate) depolymerase